MVDLTPFKAQIDAAMRSAPQICSDPRSAFISVLQAEGFTVPKTLQIGQIQRIDSPEDKKGKKSGWCAYYEIEDTQNDGQIIGTGVYGCWKGGYQKDWCSRSQHQMSVAERINYLNTREKMKADYERETIEKNIEAAKIAYEIWNQSPEATKDHPYLKLKGVNAANGIKVSTKDARLIIPVAINNEITSLQFINANSVKRFLTGGKVKGGYFEIEGNRETIYVTEGYATAASIHQATGATVYIAFNAGNIYEVASYVKNISAQSRIVIAGDDDTGTTGNPGRTKAEQAAEGLGLSCIFPNGANDFNDMHKSQGIGALKAYLNPSHQQVYERPEKETANNIDRPCGVLGDIIDYYNATSGNHQPGFAIQTALALCSIVLARSYKTNFENFTSLYFINVGKSGTGKEHTKNVIERILCAVNLDRQLIAGDGYTSAGAVFSTLLDKPKHINVIDEFGRYLEAGRDMQKGNHHQREANTKLMESIGRAHSVMRPPNYSSMTLKKEQAEATKNRHVYNPAITIVGMTTPSTLFKTLDMGAIRDGFFNRFIVSISDAQRAVRKHKPPIDVPDRIIKWIHNVIARNDHIHICSEPATPIVLEFTTEAIELQNEFQEYCVKKANYLERFGMEELTGRSNEMAMRIALIYALSRDYKAYEINADDMKWSIGYVKNCLEETIERLKISISHSSFEHQKKEILADLRNRSPDGITWAQMQKTPPYSQHKPKDLKEIMQSLKDADLAGDEIYINEKGGRPTTKWIALN